MPVTLVVSLASCCFYLKVHDAELFWVKDKHPQMDQRLLCVMSSFACNCMNWLVGCLFTAAQGHCNHQLDNNQFALFSHDKLFILITTIIKVCSTQRDFDLSVEASLLWCVCTNDQQDSVNCHIICTFSAWCHLCMRSGAVIALFLFHTSKTDLSTLQLYQNPSGAALSVIKAPALCYHKGHAEVMGSAYTLNLEGFSNDWPTLQHLSLF